MVTKSSRAIDHHTTAMRLSTTIILVIGPPGAGKGTLCKRLAEEIGWHHFSVGDHVRNLSKLDDTLAITVEQCGGISISEIRNCLREHKALPADVMAAIILHKIHVEERDYGKRPILIDGYPRTIECAELFEREVGEPVMVVMFECPKDIARARFVSRKRGNDDADFFEERYARHAALYPEICARYASVAQKVSRILVSGKIIRIITDDQQLITSGEEEDTYNKLRVLVSTISS